jgi:hypothetical protein
LIVETRLSGVKILTIELRGEFDSGTVLQNSFRAEHFEFIEDQTGQPVVMIDPFPGTCEPREILCRDGVVELFSKPFVTSLRLEDMSPHSDPVRQLEVGHTYRMKLKPRRLSCCKGTVEELFRGRRYVPVEELPLLVDVMSNDELLLKVEA